MAAHLLTEHGKAISEERKARFVNNVSEQLGVLIEDLVSEFAPRESAIS